MRHKWPTRWWRGFVVLAVLSLGFSLSSILPTSAASTELPYRLVPAMSSSAGIAQRGLVADGSLFVWQDARNGSPDVFAHDIDDNREFRVSRAPASRTQPAVSGSRVVWVAGADPARRTIEGVDLSENRAFQVTTVEQEVSDPVISGDFVVWRQRDGDRWWLQMKNLKSGESWNVSAGSPNLAHPAISGTNLVWQEFRDGQWDISLHDVARRETKQITVTGDDETNPVIGDTSLAFIRKPQRGGPPQLILFDLKSGREKAIVSTHQLMRPSIGHGVLVWEDWRTGFPDIYAYDIAQDTSFAVVRSQQATNPAVSDAGIAWISRLDASRSRVQAISFVTRLPSDPRESPAVPSADHVYVPETRQFMSSGFKNFWQGNGGPQLFGYPLTEEFTEKDPAGQNVVVQYFERMVLEFRASASEGQRITLARLGATLTADRRFERISEFESTSDRVYFAETGHSVAYGFKEFWDWNGGLRIFGFPISEEFVENGRTVQYFERARFEFNPSSDDARYRVILGLLGQEALQRKGWLPRPPIDTTMISE